MQWCLEADTEKTLIIQSKLNRYKMKYDQTKRQLMSFIKKIPNNETTPCMQSQVYVLRAITGSSHTNKYCRILILLVCPTFQFEMSNYR